MLRSVVACMVQWMRPGRPKASASPPSAVLAVPDLVAPVLDTETPLLNFDPEQTQNFGDAVSGLVSPVVLEPPLLATTPVPPLTATVPGKSNPFWTGSGIAGFLGAPRQIGTGEHDVHRAEACWTSDCPTCGEPQPGANVSLTFSVQAEAPDSSEDRANEAAALLRSIIADSEAPPQAVNNLLGAAGAIHIPGLPQQSSVPFIGRQAATRVSLSQRLELVRAGNRPLRASILPRRNSGLALKTLLLGSQPAASQLPESQPSLAPSLQSASGLSYTLLPKATLSVAA